MKNIKYLAFFVFLFTSSVCVSQKWKCNKKSKDALAKTIIVKMNSNNNLVLPKVKIGESFNIKISGFNPLLYKYQIAVNDSVSSIGSVPGLFDLFTITNLTTLASNIADRVTTTAPVIKVESLEKKSVDFNVLSDPNILQMCKCCSSNQADFINTYFEGLGDSLSIILQSSSDSIKACALFGLLSVESKNLDELKQLAKNTNLAFLDFQIASRRPVYDNSLSDIVFDYGDFQSKLKEIIRINNKVKDHLNHINLDTSKVAPIKSFSKKLKVFNLENRILATSLDTTILFEKYIEIMAAFETYKDFKTYTSLPIYMDDNIKNIHISIKPFNDKIYAQPYSTKFQVKPNRILSYGFSSGFFATRLTNKFYSERINADSTFSPVLEDTPKYNIGVQAMVHTYVNVCDNFSFHLGLGPTLTFNSKLRPGIGIGGGIAIGSKNKVVITLGCNMSYVSRLSNAYIIDETYKSSSTSYTVDKLNRDWFVSIGYNFF